MLAHDSHVTDPHEIARLSSQNAKILARLQQGPASNRELAELSLKYTSRLSDLRHAGYDVRCERGEHGLNIYTLVQPQRAPMAGHDVNGFSLR